jgi:WD40 repeat protein
MSDQNPPLPSNPYVGPYPIQAGQPFFGRKLETAELASRVVARRIVLLHSPSGAGKTSLIQAGLVPEMERQNYLVLPILHLNLTPLQSEMPAASPNRFILSFLLSLEAKLPEEQRTPVSELVDRALQPDALLEYLTAYRQKYAEVTEQIGRKRTLMIFDQFEEILTIQPADRSSKEQFFNELMPVLDDNHYWVLFAMREDYLARLDPYLGYFPERLSAHFQLDFLGIEAARQAIEEPVKPFGIAYTQEAIELLLHDLSLVRVLDETNNVVERPGSYIEPVELQVVCERLWRAEREDRAHITLHEVQQSGKVIDALAGYYAEAVDKAAAGTQTPVRNIRQWFEQALIAEGGLRQPVPQGSELEFGVSPECASSLVNAYLVRVEEQRGTLWYRLAHDRLVEAVMRDNARWNAENLSLLQRQALLWDREGRPDHLLLQDAALAEAESWQNGEHDPLRQEEKDLLERSQELHRKKQAETEKERLNTRRIRRSLIVAVSVAAVALVALLFAIWALSQVQTEKNRAETAKIAAEQSQLTAEAAKKTADFNRKEADANAAEARIQSTKAAGDKALAQAGQGTATAALATVQSLATRSAIEQARADEEQRKALSQRLAFQSQQIASSDPDLASLLSIEAYKAYTTTEATNILLSSIYTASVTIEQVGEPVGGFSSDIYSVAISPDERFIAVGCGNGDVFLIDLQDENPRAKALPYRHGSNRVNGLAFSPDGAMLASSGNDAQLFLYNMATEEFKAHQLARSSSALSFRPDGLKLAVNEGFDFFTAELKPGSLALGAKKFYRREVDSGYLHDIAYSPDGARLAVSEEGEPGLNTKDYLTMFNADNGNLQFLKGVHTNVITALDWSPDNRTLVTAGFDGKLIAWDTLTKEYIELPDSHNALRIYDAAVSYDGRYVVSGGWDGFTRVASLPDLLPLIGAANENLLTDVLAVAVSPRSYLIASGGTDRLVTVRRLVTQPSLADEVGQENGQVRGLVVNPQGELFWIYPDRMSNYHYIRSSGGLFSEKPAEIEDVFSVALHPDGRLAAYGGANGVIYTTSVEDPFADAWPALEVNEEIRGLAFNQNGKRLASSYCSQKSSIGKCLSSAIWLWDVETRQPSFFTELEGAGLVRALAFDPDEKYLAAGAEDGKVVVYDLTTGKPLPLSIKPSPSEVLSLAYSRNGEMLAGGNRGGDMLLWNAASGYQDLGRLNIGSSGALYSLAFDPDGVHLYTGGASGDIMKWAISPDLWIDIICKRVGRSMTPDEWREFFFNDDLQETCPDIAS